MKAPLTWPNISLSRRFSGRAAQFTATHGFDARGEFLWIVLAMTSLPVPDSPLMSTVAAVGATFWIMSQTWTIRGELPMRFSKRYLSGASTFIVVASDSCFFTFSSARCRQARMSSTLKGLVR